MPNFEGKRIEITGRRDDGSWVGLIEDTPPASLVTPGMPGYQKKRDEQKAQDAYIQKEVQRILDKAREEEPALTDYEQDVFQQTERYTPAASQSTVAPSELIEESRADQLRHLLMRLSLEEPQNLDDLDLEIRSLLARQFSGGALSEGELELIDLYLKQSAGALNPSDTQRFQALQSTELKISSTQPKPLPSQIMTEKPSTHPLGQLVDALKKEQAKAHLLRGLLLERRLAKGGDYTPEALDQEFSSHLQKYSNVYTQADIDAYRKAYQKEFGEPSSKLGPASSEPMAQDSVSDSVDPRELQAQPRETTISHSIGMRFQSNVPERGASEKREEESALLNLGEGPQLEERLDETTLLSSKSPEKSPDQDFTPQWLKGELFEQSLVALKNFDAAVVELLKQTRSSESIEAFVDAVQFLYHACQAALSNVKGSSEENRDYEKNLTTAQQLYDLMAYCQAKSRAGDKLSAAKIGKIVQGWDTSQAIKETAQQILTEDFKHNAKKEGKHFLGRKRQFSYETTDQGGVKGQIKFSNKALIGQGLGSSKKAYQTMANNVHSFLDVAIFESGKGGSNNPFDLSTGKPPSYEVCAQAVLDLKMRALVDGRQFAVRVPEALKNGPVFRGQSTFTISPNEPMSPQEKAYFKHFAQQTSHIIVKGKTKEAKQNAGMTIFQNVEPALDLEQGLDQALEQYIDTQKAVRHDKQVKQAEVCLDRLSQRSAPRLR